MDDRHTKESRNSDSSNTFDRTSQQPEKSHTSRAQSSNHRDQERDFLEASLDKLKHTYQDLHEEDMLQEALGLTDPKPEEEEEEEEAPLSPSFPSQTSNFSSSTDGLDMDLLPLDVQTVLKQDQPRSSSSSRPGGLDVKLLAPDIQEMLKQGEALKTLRPGQRKTLMTHDSKVVKGMSATQQDKDQDQQEPRNPQPSTSKSTPNSQADAKLDHPTQTHPSKRDATPQPSREKTPPASQKQRPTQTTGMNVDKAPSTNFSSLNTQSELEHLRQDVDNLRSSISALYIPKHFDNLMKKVGDIESSTKKAEASMATCYNWTFFMMLLFVLLCLGVVYVIWRMNYFKFLFRQNLFGRFQKPKTCFACFRPWRRRSKARMTWIKKSMSAPEFDESSRPRRHESAPMPHAVRTFGRFSSSSGTGSSSGSASSTCGSDTETSTVRITSKTPANPPLSNMSFSVKPGTGLENNVQTCAPKISSALASPSPSPSTPS